MSKSLRAWRAERLLSTRRLAELAGTSNKTIVQLENGRQTASFGTIEKLCRALGVAPREVSELARALDEHAGLTSSEPAGDPLAARKRVFCVSASAAFLALVRRLLEAERYGIATVIGTPVTFEQVASFQPDLLIIDLEAGRALGWDLLEQLQNEARASQLPVIVTARDKRLLAHATLAPERDDGQRVLVVPFDRELRTLVAAVESLLGTGQSAPDEHEIRTAPHPALPVGSPR